MSEKKWMGMYAEMAATEYPEPEGVSITMVYGLGLEATHIVPLERAQMIYDVLVILGAIKRPCILNDGDTLTMDGKTAALEKEISSLLNVMTGKDFGSLSIQI